MPTYQDMEGNWIRTDVTIQEMQEEIDRLTIENAALRELAQFYSDGNQYDALQLSKTLGLEDDAIDAGKGE